MSRFDIISMATIETLLSYLAMYGGEIVSSASLNEYNINQARASGRMYVDGNSLGFVWVPPIRRIPQTVEEVEILERWYPLNPELPEELKSPDFLFKKRFNAGDN